MKDNQGSTPKRHLGEALLERVERRAHRRPKMGMSPGFYLRLGLDDPWLLDAPVGGYEEGPEGLVYLASSPYWAALARLGRARLAREIRHARFLESHGQARMHVAERRFPGEAPPVLSTLGKVALEMQLPQKEEPAAAVATGVIPNAIPRYHRRAHMEPTRAVTRSNRTQVPTSEGPGTMLRRRAAQPTEIEATSTIVRRSKSARTVIELVEDADGRTVTRKIRRTPSAAITDEDRRADEVVAGRTQGPSREGSRLRSMPAWARDDLGAPERRPVRALEHTGARLEASVQAASPVTQALDGLLPFATVRSAQKAIRVVAQIEALRREGRLPEIARLLGQLGIRAGAVEEALSTLTDDAIRGTDVARGRSAGDARTRGLRSMVTSSPLLTTLAAAAEPDPGVDDAATETGRPVRSARAGRIATRATEDAAPFPTERRARAQVSTVPHPIGRAPRSERTDRPERQADTTARTARGHAERLALRSADARASGLGDSGTLSGAAYAHARQAVGVERAHSIIPRGATPTFLAAGDPAVEATEIGGAVTPGRARPSPAAADGTEARRGRARERTGGRSPRSREATAADPAASVASARSTPTEAALTRLAHTGTSRDGSLMPVVASEVPATVAGRLLERVQARADLDGDDVEVLGRLAEEPLRSERTPRSQRTPEPGTLLDPLAPASVATDSDVLARSGVANFDSRAARRAAIRERASRVVPIARVAASREGSTASERDLATSEGRRATRRPVLPSTLPSALPAASGREVGFRSDILPRASIRAADRQALGGPRHGSILPESVLLAPQPASLEDHPETAPRATARPVTLEVTDGARTWRLRSSEAAAVRHVERLVTSLAATPSRDTAEPFRAGRRPTGPAAFAGSHRSPEAPHTLPLASAWTFLVPGTPPALADEPVEEAAGPSKQRTIRASGTPQGSAPTEARANRQPGTLARAASRVTALGHADARGAHRPTAYRSALAGEPSVPGAESAPMPKRTESTAPEGTLLGARHDSPEMEGGDGTPRGRSARAGLEHTLGRMTDGAPGENAPIWAQRSTGAPRIRGAGDLVQALAKATEAEQVLQVMIERGSDLKQMASSLPAPMAQLLQQMSGEARRGTEAERSEPASRGPKPRGTRPATRSVTRFVGLRRHASAKAVDGVSADRVMGLAKRLNDLIHLAESGQKDAARGQVRMAEDSAAARAEGNAEPAQATNKKDSNIDIDALGREVLEAVGRELELRRERRQEDSEDGNWW